MSRRLSLATVKAAKPEDKDYFLWDGELKGFGLKVCKGGRKVYVCKYRAGSGRSAPSRRMTIGAHGSPWTPDAARKEAARLLGRVAQGEDPAREKQDAKAVISVAELCDRYLKAGVATKKASTLATDRGRIERHIKPLLGKMRITDVTRADVAQFLQDVAAGKTAVDLKTRKRGRAIVKGGKGTATRTVGLLGGIFTYAIDAGWLKENPVRGVKRFRDRRNERFLDADELTRLGEALAKAEAEGENPYALAIIRLLLLTGARKGEIERLKWSEVDRQFQYLRLGDSKTGQKLIVLNQASLSVLEQVPRMKGTEFVFPASRSDGWYEGTPKVWARIRQTVGLKDVRLHDLRHSFASAAASGGVSLQLIGALLGHKDGATTARYAHLGEDPIRNTSNLVSLSILNALRSGETGGK
ncbi:site-specific integrase [Hyphomonas sp. ND6WE1B]|uniref:tyrosine-type recombinase/integrase n=1 Tax=Hyphomonas sp. ND6WE1B TaxID=1848191 RepID=UPI0008075FAD|nr:site-specific integrase [Hyphomonas sp. ND6WE1B]